MDIHTEQPLPPASLFRRLMAMLYDAFLLMGISFAYGVIVLLLRRLAGEDTMLAPSNVLQVIIVLGLWCCYALFYIWCWRRTGQTLGMKSWRLQLQGCNSQLPTLKECWVRCILAPFSMTFLGIGYLWCLIDKHGNCLHDIYSNTKVIVLPKEKRNKK